MDAKELLRVEDLECAYGSVRVLSGVSFALKAGEVLGIAGENGAGKSTLVKSICGLLAPRSGRIVRACPVAAIHQEFNLAPDLTVAENLFLGSEITKKGLLDLKGMRRRAKELFAPLGVSIDPDCPVGTLTVAEKQMVEIAKAAGAEAGLLIMDEPTTVLNQVETARLFKLMAALTARGTGIIYISHKLDEVLSVCSRVLVLRDGETVGCFDASMLTAVTLAEKMVGRELKGVFPEKLPASQGEVRLEAEHLCAPGVKDISFTLRSGEILGLAGLNGAGRTELAEALFGLRKITSGTVRIDGQAVRIRSAADALRHNMAFLTEDRQGSGILPEFPIAANMTLCSLPRYARAGMVSSTKIFRRALEYIRSFRIRCTGPEQPVRDLSGGNQQKAAIAKCLDTSPRIFIFDEPTRGVDVGARREIYDFLRGLAAAGCACLLISSDLEELLGLCRRVLVIRGGASAGFVEEEELDEQHIIRKATGVEA